MLDGAGALFCGPECEGAWCLRSSGGALRRALFRLERGVCQLCRLDSHALLQRLRRAARPASAECPARPLRQRRAGLQPPSRAACSDSCSASRTRVPARKALACTLRTTLFFTQQGGMLFRLQR